MILPHTSRPCIKETKHAVHSSTQQSLHTGYTCIACCLTFFLSCYFATTELSDKGHIKRNHFIFSVYITKIFCRLLFCLHTVACNLQHKLMLLYVDCICRERLGLLCHCGSSLVELSLYVPCTFHIYQMLLWSSSLCAYFVLYPFDKSYALCCILASVSGFKSCQQIRTCKDYFVSSDYVTFSHDGFDSFISFVQQQLGHTYM